MKHSVQEAFEMKQECLLFPYCGMEVLPTGLILSCIQPALLQFQVTVVTWFSPQGKVTKTSRTVRQPLDSVRIIGEMLFYSLCSLRVGGFGVFVFWVFLVSVSQ